MVIGITMVKVMPGQERLVYFSLKGKDGILDVYHILVVNLQKVVIYRSY
jgi:hypothetical protein